MRRLAGTLVMAAVWLMFCSAAQARQNANPRSSAVAADALPDAPGLPFTNQQGTSTAHTPASQSPTPAKKSKPTPCPATNNVPYSNPEAASAAAARTPCVNQENPYRLFLNSTAPSHLTPRQKGILAVHNVVDPFNLLTVAGNSAVTIAADSHSAYGPGLKGFGRSAGYSFVQDATGEVIGTFLICSAFHEDPHYHRMPEARPMRRFVHAVSRTFVAQHDDGHLMPNVENLLGYPASAEISNLYVPGIHGNAPSTVARVATGLATDPVNNIITEFLPDVARRVHVRIVFVQQIINEVARGDQM